MSAGNRKNTYQPRTQAEHDVNNRAYIYLLALVAAAGLLLGLILIGGSR